MANEIETGVIGLLYFLPWISRAVVYVRRRNDWPKSALRLLRTAKFARNRVGSPFYTMIISLLVLTRE